MIGRAFARATARALDDARSRIGLRGATRLGGGARLFGWPRVVCEGELRIGRDVVFVSSPSPIQLVVARGATLTIGDGALLESGVTVRARKCVSLGARARLGAGCIVDDDGIEPIDIVIGDDAWIEDGAVILAGTSVGPKQVVSRGAIVRGEVEEPIAATTQSPPSRAAESNETAREIDSRMRKAIARIVPAIDGAEPSADLTRVKGWDSLAALRVIVALEKEFSVVLPHDLLSEQATLEMLATFMVATTSPSPEAS